METPRKTHPMIIAAAVSVTALSLTGVAALAGWLPQHGSTAAAPVAPLAAALPAENATASTVQKTEGPATLAIPSGSRITVEPKASAPRQARSETRRVAAAPQDSGYTRVSQPVNDNGIYVENARPAPVQTQNAPQPYGQQAECGTVESVREIGQPGEGSWIGSVAGGVLGGLLGNQVGRGNGKTLATVAGAVGGAFAGREVEKHVRTDKQYQVTVRFDDGSVRSYTETSEPAVRSGDRVRASGNRLDPL